MNASSIIRSFGSNSVPRWIVVLDADAAEIMGETRMRYAFADRTAAERFSAVLQSNLDASFVDARRETVSA